jgi:3-dehydroquinate synthase
MSGAAFRSGESSGLSFTFGGCVTRVAFLEEEGAARPVADFPDSVGLRPAPGESGREARPSGLVVIDRSVRELHGRALSLPDDARVVSIPPGEGSKSWERARDVLQAAVRAGLDRDGTIIGVGGGMVCDLAAFCASLYMRGCRLVLVPTTMLAMVDAALGGKTAVNFEGFKNLVGTFYPAGELRISIAMLSTLPERELRSGLAEVIKTALLGDEGLVGILESERGRILRGDPVLLGELVRRCLIVKGRVVEEDFREVGRRAILNLGHTFAHALEAASGIGAWSHGDAVAWGMARAARLGGLLGVTPTAHAARTVGLLAAYGYRTGADAGVPPRQLLAAMRADKKRRDGRLRLVLQRAIGDTVVQGVEEALILRSLEGG